MKKSPKPTPGNSSKGQASQDARAVRQAKALRDNLHRRKQQARGRNAGEPVEQAQVSNDSPDSPEGAK